MMYLFNSAARPQYAENVCNTLFYPSGWANEYRYDYQGQPYHIDPTKVDEFVKTKKGEDVLIIFVDRYSANGYTFHPLRKAKLISCRQDGVRLFFKVKLGEFTYPNNNQDFNARLIRIGNVPHLTNNDPDNHDDGFYAIKSNDIRTGQSMMVGDTSWDTIVTNISRTRVFAARADHESVFARLTMTTRWMRWFKKTPVINKDEIYFKVTKNESYNFSLYYRYPNQVGANSVTLKLSTKGSTTILTEESIPINNNSNAHNINFRSKRYVEDPRDGMRFQYSSNNQLQAPATLCAPNCTIGIKVIDGPGFWAQMILALLLFGLIELIFNGSISIQSLEDPSQIDKLTWLKAAGGVLKGAVLVWTFRLIGKKVM